MKELTEEQVRKIIEALENGNFEATNDGPGMPDDMKITNIWVEDFDGEPVSVGASYIEDGPKFGVPNASTVHTIKVLDYTFTGVEEDYDSEIDWELQSETYCMPDDEDLLEELTEALDDNREGVDFESTYTVDSVFDEWSDDELRDLFDSELEHDYYLDIDGDYYGYDGDVEDFVEEYGDLFDEDQVGEILSGTYQELSREDLIEILINNDIEIS